MAESVDCFGISFSILEICDCDSKSFFPISISSIEKKILLGIRTSNRSIDSLLRTRDTIPFHSNPFFPSMQYFPPFHIIYTSFPFHFQENTKREEKMIDHVHGPAGRSRRSKYGRENLLPEDLDGTPALLAAERTRLLPEIVVHREHDGLATDGGLDALDGSDLLILTGAGLSVAGSGGGPSGLEVESVLAWAETVDDLELRGDELTGVLGVNVGVEEGVDVAADDVDDGAEDGGVLLPDIKGLGGGHGAGVASELEGGLAGDDEGSELNAGAGSGEDGLVTDDDEVDHAPLVPGNDVGHLLGCS